MRRAASGPCRPLIVGGDRLVLATNVDHHLLDDLDALADYDRVLWVEQGRIERDGPAKEVIAAYVAAMKGQGSSDDFADL